VKGKKKAVQKCTTRLSSSPQRFTATAAIARVSRSGHLYATGSLRAGKLMLHASQVLPAGRYTLTLTTGTGKTRHSRKEPLTVGKTITAG
jgi:hypothetical protein